MNDSNISLSLTLNQLRMLDVLLTDKVGELQAANRPWNPPVGPVAQQQLSNMKFLRGVVEQVILREEALLDAAE